MTASGTINRNGLWTSFVIACLTLSLSSGWISPYNAPLPTKKKLLGTTTSLFMFDWFNPNKKKDPEEKKDDIFDWLNPGSEKKAKDEKEKTEQQQQPTESSNSAAAANASNQKKEEAAPAVVSASTAAVPEQEHKEEKETKGETESASAADKDSIVHKGKVRWFDSQKGFGFISRDGNSEGDDVFVHHSAIDASGYRRLNVGESVEFQIKVDDKGRSRAVHVTGPDGSAVQFTLKKQQQQKKQES